MEEKKSFRKGALCGALAMLLIIAIIGITVVIFALLGFGTVMGDSTEQKLQSINSLLQSRYLYYDDIDEEALQDGIVKGYVDALEEPYTAYYNEEETKMLFESNSGEFGGIGVGILQDMNTMQITFSVIYEGEPGEKAGFKANDIVYKVNGEDVTGMDIDTVVAKIRGEIGTTVEITVLRGENLEEYTAQVTRELIQTQAVSYEMKENKIGYIQVVQFEKVAAEQFETALNDLQEQGMKALIVDLRNNPGGDLDTVCEMADLILPEGVIVSTADRNGKGTTRSSDEEHQIDVPMVILVNENSASASEIFAGAAKDHGVATIVGTTTYGKGIVQEIYQLSDGTSVKLTSSEYLTKSGNKIHGVGITPDVEIALEYDENQPEYDNQLEKAIEILKNGM